MFGLGIAEIEKGLAESGNDRIEAATEIDPRVAARFRRLELSPSTP
jgi:hypothetical protein